MPMSNAAKGIRSLAMAGLMQGDMPNAPGARGLYMREQAKRLMGQPIFMHRAQQGLVNPTSYLRTLDAVEGGGIPPEPDVAGLFGHPPPPPGSIPTRPLATPYRSGAENERDLRNQIRSAPDEEQRQLRQNQLEQRARRYAQMRMAQMRSIAGGLDSDFQSALGQTEELDPAQAWREISRHLVARAQQRGFQDPRQLIESLLYDRNLSRPTGME